MQKSCKVYLPYLWPEMGIGRAYLTAPPREELQASKRPRGKNVKLIVRNDWPDKHRLKARCHRQNYQLKKGTF